MGTKTGTYHPAENNGRRDHSGLRFVQPRHGPLAGKTGAAERTMRQDVQIGKAIPAGVHEKIRDTPGGDSKSELQKLSHLKSSSAW